MLQCLLVPFKEELTLP